MSRLAGGKARTDLLGYREEEVVGTRFETWIHPEDRAAGQHMLQALHRSKSIRDFDVRIHARNGD
ncbi:PAS domain-containing protein [Microvirga makkahensis]|uniref:PAS domain-containing protein n=1 Tax=Microvirga makkahensis TaxID=1128670 RepID=A0A7X3SPP8_9HYPH|nr:PAS domain-containing protein [Microvirga makkahensis]MXQ12485.1 PAS domain-containing protein [Microvirga makkahensis]